MAYEPLTGDAVRAKSDEEIAEELKQLRDKLYTLRVQSVTEKVEDNSLFRKLRGDIARLLTEQNARRRRAAEQRVAAG
jgi:large subunit ribosomal protein L29